MVNDESEPVPGDVEGTSPRFTRFGPARLWLALGCIVIFFSSLFLYSRENNFSSLYHPDEFDKAKQLVTHQRVYLHPSLLLEGTNLALKLSRQQLMEDRSSVRKVILTGRWISAIYAALAVTAFAVIGYVYRGFVGFLLAGLFVSLCPSLLVNAHYMKEDTALILGLATTLLALIIYSKRAASIGPQAVLVFVGVATALAASGKYIGILVFVAALIYIAFPWDRTKSLRRCGTVLTAFAIVTLLINYSVFLDWEAFKLGLSYETNHALTQHFGGTVMNRPNSFALEALVRETMPHILFLAAAFLGWFVLFWKSITRWEWFLMIFTAAFAVMLSFSVIPLYRYNLPVIILLHLMAALVVAKWVTSLKRPLNVVVLALAISLIPFVQIRRCLNYLDQFANDSHVRLRSFLAQNVPPGSSIAADAFAIVEPDDDPRLSEAERHPPFRIAMGFWAADLGDYNTLRELVDYIAVSETAYGRFFDPHVRSAPNDTHYQACRRFYEQLFAHGELVWSSDPHPPTYSFVNPPLRLYRVSPTR